MEYVTGRPNLHRDGHPPRARPQAQPQVQPQVQPQSPPQVPPLTPLQAQPQTRGGKSRSWTIKHFAIFFLLAPCLMLLREASVYHPPYAIKFKPHSQSWLEGSAVLPTVPARCPDNTIASSANCTGPWFLYNDEVETQNLTILANSVDTMISNAEFKPLNLLPGRPTIIPRLRELQRHIDLVEKRNQEGLNAFYVYQDFSLETINKAFDKAGQTYFVDSNTPPRFLCAGTLCDRTRDQQRFDRAKILWTFQNKMITNVETLMQGNWLIALKAEIAALDQTLLNVRIAANNRWNETGYYDEKTCRKCSQEKPKKCAAFDLSDGPETIIEGISKADDHTEKLLQVAVSYYRCLKQVTVDMREKAGEINKAQGSETYDTILDDPKKFQEFVWWFGKQVRAGVASSMPLSDHDGRDYRGAWQRDT